MRSLVLIGLVSISSFDVLPQKPTASAIRDLLKPMEKPGEGESVAWMACDEDSTYYLNDTVKLYRNYYYCFGSGCCRFVRWHLAPKYTLTLTEFRFCQEPPVSGVRMENQDLKFKIKRSGNMVTIAVLRNKEVIDKFEVVDLRTVTLPESNQTSERLTLRRIRS